MQEDVDLATEHQKFLNQQIADVRRAMSDLECANKENDDEPSDVQTSIQSLVQQCENLHEARYLMEQLVNFAIAKSAQVEKNGNKIKVGICALCVDLLPCSEPGGIHRAERIRECRERALRQRPDHVADAANARHHPRHIGDRWRDATEIRSVKFFRFFVCFDVLRCS